MRRLAHVPFALALVACGSSTGLEIGDAAVSAARDASPALDAAPARDASPAHDAAPLPPDSCAPVTTRLTPLTAELLFVIDRSTSMGWALTGPGGPGPSRWSILGDTLRAQLPRYDATTDMGVLLFPYGDTGSLFCSNASAPQLAPTPSASARLLSIVGAQAPGGRTPTAGAMSAARSFFASHPSPGHPQAVILGTDGAPNCNVALDPATCRCTGGAGLPADGCGEAELCLDDAATLDAITALARDGVPTYVVGIDGDPDPAVSAVLTALARAGGRPNPLDATRAYYSVRRPEDLGAAFDRIEASLERCSLELASPVVRPGGDAAVLMDGEPLPRDESDGWEWSPDGSPLVVLHGDACERARMGSHDLELTAACGR